MKTYIGTKIIKATPMTDMEFEAEKNLVDSAKQTVKLYKEGHSLLRNGNDSGVCAGYERRDPKDGYKVMYPDGYTSWSPKIVFEEAYREISQAERGLI